MRDTPGLPPGLCPVGWDIYEPFLRFLRLGTADDLATLPILPLPDFACAVNLLRCTDCLVDTILRTLYFGIVGTV
jgi:hypothetical protein